MQESTGKKQFKDCIAQLERRSKFNFLCTPNSELGPLEFRYALLVASLTLHQEVCISSFFLLLYMSHETYTVRHAPRTY